MADSPSAPAAPKKRNKPRNRNKPPDDSSAPSSNNNNNRKQQQAVPSTNRRAAKFNAGLTNANDQQRSSSQATHASSSSSHHGRRPPRPKEPEDDTLASSLAHQLRTPPYPDCMICFNPLRPEQPVWSCTPAIQLIEPHAQCCWTVIHLKCIKPWASKSKKEFEDALRARGEDDWMERGEWRCPGCQGRRRDLVAGYFCFCGSVKDPSPTRLATPHSCASPCSRPRPSCAHPCPLACHPGPCPPCKILVPVKCSCPKAISGQVRCADLAGSSSSASHSVGAGLTVTLLSDATPSVTCGSVCSKVKRCGNPAHRCDKICHEGPCDPCTVPLREGCICSKSTRIVECESRLPSSLALTADEDAIGDWRCTTPCAFPFDCGHHSCTDICHSHPDAATKCPMDPSIVTTCPCGKSTITPFGASSGPYDFPARESCRSSIPTCTQSCLKTLSLCGHICSRKCHRGSCEPCGETVVRPCRCGSKVIELPCYELYDKETGREKDLLCERACPALRNCGRHECRRICCPLASLAAERKKHKGKQREREAVLEENDPEGLHVCDRICDKPLSCGNHNCTQPDHRGPCPPCLQSTYTELLCPCERTVLSPPIPCGVTQVPCSYPCHRGPFHPSNCGHTMPDHRCHYDNAPCPPCAFLVRKPCACGKVTLQHQRCSIPSDKLSCGKQCGKVNSQCGVHRCTKVCHTDEEGCGTCKEKCGKARKSCGHPCPEPCHAPSICPEDAPCPSQLTISCPCGRITRQVQCGRSSSSPAASADEPPPTPTGLSSNKGIKCTTECAIAKRNARLADALGITPSASSASSSAQGTSYSEDLKTYARTNARFVLQVEKVFAEFVQGSSEKKVLPSMGSGEVGRGRRGVVVELANVYRMSTQLVDVEPNRSVQLIRRIDTRIPTPLLSQLVATSSTLNGATNPWGRLTDLKKGSTTPPSGSGLQPLRSSSSTVLSPMPSVPTGKGWAAQRSSPVPVWRTATTSAQQAKPSASSNTAGINAQSSPRFVPAPAVLNNEDVPENWEDEDE